MLCTNRQLEDKHKFPAYELWLANAAPFVASWPYDVTTTHYKYLERVSGSAVEELYNSVTLATASDGSMTPTVPEAWCRQYMPPGPEQEEGAPLAWLDEPIPAGCMVRVPIEWEQSTRVYHPELAVLHNQNGFEGVPISHDMAAHGCTRRTDDTLDFLINPLLTGETQLGGHRYIALPSCPKGLVIFLRCQIICFIWYLQAELVKEANACFEDMGITVRIEEDTQNTRPGAFDSVNSLNCM